MAAAQKSYQAFRTISEAAGELDVPQHVLRFWETKFSQIKPMKRGGGRRYYRPEDIDLLKGIRKLLYEDGFTIKGAQKIFREHGAKFVQEVGSQIAFDERGVEEDNQNIEEVVPNQDEVVEAPVAEAPAAEAQADEIQVEESAVVETEQDVVSVAETATTHEAVERSDQQAIAAQQDVMDDVTDEVENVPVNQEVIGAHTDIVSESELGPGQIHLSSEDITVSIKMEADLLEVAPSEAVQSSSDVQGEAAAEPVLPEDNTNVHETDGIDEGADVRSDARMDANGDTVEQGAGALGLAPGHKVSDQQREQLEAILAKLEGLQDEIDRTVSSLSRTTGMASSDANVHGQEADRSRWQANVSNDDKDVPEHHHDEQNLAVKRSAG